MKRVLLVIWLFFLLIVQTPGYALTEPPVSDDEVNRLASELYCPVCENVPLEVCPTKACAQWRELIREKLALGWNDEEIKAYFATQYGDQVLAVPPRRGFNWLIYLVPPLTLVAGILIAIRVIRKPKTIPAAQEVSNEGPCRMAAEDFISQIENDLEGVE